MEDDRVSRSKAVDWQAGPAECRCCGSVYDAPAWNFREGQIYCAPCRRARQAEARANRKERGMPNKSGNASSAYYREYRTSPEQRLKNATRALTRKAIASGVLVRQPCKECGSDAEAHHEDYSKPYEIAWLCKQHHAKRHAEIRLEQLLATEAAS